jgi:hypothetical protein
MFKFKDIIKMDYETCKRMVAMLNESQSEFVLQINKNESSLEFKIGEEVIDKFTFSVEPWMEPDD